MTEVRTFRADTMQEALDLVRTEMGSEAVILHTRQFSQRRFLPWRKPAEVVEITAGLGVNIRTPRDGISPSPRRRSVFRSANSSAPSAAKPARSSAASDRPKSGRKSSRSPEARAETAESADVFFERVASDAEIAAIETPPSPRLPSSSRAANRVYPSHRLSAAESASPAVAPKPVDHRGPTAELATKLDSIQKMLQELGRQSRLGVVNEIPDELFHIYAELIDAEVEDDLARELIARLKKVAKPEQLSDAAAVKTLLSGMVEAEIRCCGPIVPQPGTRKVIALVGSTGVGKTTTIAKLAANFRLRDGVTMGLVTVDTYRIAAVEQLRTYAEIIDLPMKVVTNPLEMRRALDELIGLDLVLIDTAGRSPRDELQIQELKSLLSEADVDEVHLVLNMTASMRTLEATAKKFASAKTSAVIMTKLDEAIGMGALLSVSRKIQLPISYLTTGQDVPDDIEPAHASRVARLVLGQDRIIE